MTKYNKTQLTPQNEFERHIYHRDQFAHYFRWSHVLKNAKIGQNILDFGCGSGEMLELFYRNKYRPARYVGMDIRSLDANKAKFGKLDFAEWYQCDLCAPELPAETEGDYDIITTFEVIEHIGHKNIDVFLNNILSRCNPDTVIYASTPNYDEQVGAAKNHILDGAIGEWTYEDLRAVLEGYFDIQHVYGTFASMKDYKKDLTGWQKEAFDALSEYYDTNMIAVIMAPMVPAYQARNCLWVLKAKEELL